jgi:hypothetical protein
MAAGHATNPTATLPAALAVSARQPRINIADSALVRAPGGTNSAATAISSAIQVMAALIP